MITNLEDFKVYNLAIDRGEEVWSVVIKWNAFEKDTVGKQLVRSADSIAANLSEGLGYYSRGSLFETKTWLTKAKTRNLIGTEQYNTMKEKLETLGRMINGYINSIGQVNEHSSEYGAQCPMPNA